MAVKVLIVEGNPVTRGVLARVVTESFSDLLQILESGDLSGAREQIAMHSQPREADVAQPPIQLMLIDLQLRGAGSLDLMAETARRSIKRIVTTLYADDDHLFPALQCGADGYLLKEDRFEVLVESLQKIVRGQPPLSPAIARRLLSHFSDELGRAHAAAPRSRLDAGEAAVLSRVSRGFTIREIASQLDLTWAAVNTHIRSIYHKVDRYAQGVAGRDVDAGSGTGH